jgi:hypothetical protein
MNLQKSKYCIFILVLTLLISCEKEVKNGNIPEFEQKLVVSSFISPGDAVSYIAVSSNRRIYGELGIIETLGDLTGYLSDDTGEIPLERTTSGFKFRPEDMKIEAGKTYKLRVISSKGLTAEASCSVPLNRNLELTIDTLRVTATYPDRYTGTSLMAKISITDYPGEDNYYRLYCKQEVYKRKNKLLAYTRQYTGFKNEFFSDKEMDGKNIEITSLGLNYVSVLDSSVYRIYIFNTTKAYYDYHISINNYSGGDDPFTEVSPVYTNITGGLGIFAAYTVDSLIFRLK